MDTGHKKLKVLALKRYYNNPRICKECGKVIVVPPGKTPSQIRKNKFCNRKCWCEYSIKGNHDWVIVQAFYDDGHNRDECIKHFGVSLVAFQKAIRDGNLKIRIPGGGIPPFPLEQVMVENSTYNRGNLKAQLLKRGILENKCAVCGLKEWMGKSLIMVLDHINGINNDHRLENLRMLCPNCDSQSPTFCGRNVKRLRLAKKEKGPVVE